MASLAESITELGPPPISSPLSYYSAGSDIFASPDRRSTLIQFQLPGDVEQVFGALKRGYGYWQARYMGLMRNEAKALFKAMAHNLRRADGLRGACATLG